MDQQRRLLLFGLVCFLTFWIYARYVVPPPENQGDRQIAETDGSDAETDGTGSSGEASGDQPKDGDGEGSQGEGNKPEIDQKELAERYTQEQRIVTLGSTDPKDGYAMAVDLTNIGAAIDTATFARFVEADDPPKGSERQQLRVIGNNLGDDLALAALDIDRKPRTFDIEIKSLELEMKKLDPVASLRTVSWKLVKTGKDPDHANVINSATFAIQSPDSQLTIEKTFSLSPVTKTDSGGDSHKSYLLDVSLRFRNSGSKTRLLTYTLQGPLGLPLENRDNTRKFRDVQASFVTPDGEISLETVPAGTIVEQSDDEGIEFWRMPVQFLGVDVQYFAALLIPGGDQQEDPYFDSVTPVIIDRDPRHENWADIGVAMTSKKLSIPADDSREHEFQLYLGPKKAGLLDEISAGETIDLGWFPSIGRLMIGLLNTFHGWGIHYGITIMMLTFIVRSAMFPISIKMASYQKQMKALQPKIMELKEKYKDDKQKFAQAQMELWQKEGTNPLMGCLPFGLIFLQLPIFVALYNALNSWTDLRMSSFLWADNLAAPDSLFPLPFTVPLLGWTDFNLLPLITVALFYIQQKIMMPPPINDEMAMQQKMMSFFPFIIGLMFYRVPSGLCVYFLTSSLWSMAERKLIDLLPEKKVDPEKQEARKKKKSGDGFFGRMMKQAMEAAEMQKQMESQRQQNQQQSANRKNRRKRK